MAGISSYRWLSFWGQVKRETFQITTGREKRGRSLQLIQSGAFVSAEEVILQALRSLQAAHPTGADLVVAIQASPYQECWAHRFCAPR
jgi:hypothetical protein